MTEAMTEAPPIARTPAPWTEGRTVDHHRPDDGGCCWRRWTRPSSRPPCRPSAVRSGDAEHLPWMLTAYLMSSTVVTPLYGKLADKHRPAHHASDGHRHHSSPARCCAACRPHVRADRGAGHPWAWVAAA
ncbi:MAG: hypothetical protein WDN06_13315 [Asticcacaulis sp.]